MIQEIFEGVPDQGKSYATSTLVYKRLKTCRQWWEKQVTKVPRHVALDPRVMKMSAHVEEEFGIWPEGYIQYYDGMNEIHTLRQCDVFIDDMGTQLGARRWQSMSSKVERWFRLQSHYECDVYGNAQSFLDIDVVVRRLAQNARVYTVHKVFGSDRPGDSKPPVKRIYGMISKRRVHYSELDKETWKRTESKLAWPMLIRKFNCSLYDTLQKIEVADREPFECYEVGCTNPNHVDRDGRPFTKFVHA